MGGGGAVTIPLKKKIFLANFSTPGSVKSDMTSKTFLLHIQMYK